MPYLCTNCDTLWAHIDAAAECCPNVQEIDDEDVIQCPSCENGITEEGKFCDACSGQGILLKPEEEEST